MKSRNRESRSRWPLGLVLATAFFLAVLGPFTNRWVAADHADHVPISVEVNRPPEEVGRWLDPMSWPLLAMHAAVLRTGEVLHFSSSILTGQEDTPASVWDPVKGTFRDVSLNSSLLCSGLSFLPNGKLYVTGGTLPDGAQYGSPSTRAFNPVSGAWKKLEDMAQGRWCPTNVTLGDGRVMILSGLSEHCDVNPRMEIYTPGRGLELIPAGERETHWSPRMHLLPSGKIAHVSPEIDTFTFDLSTQAWERVATRTYRRLRVEDTSFLVPGDPNQIMVCGGFPDDQQFLEGIFLKTKPTATCEQIDFGDARPSWKKRKRMRFARGHPDSVLLPDGTVLIVGGGRLGGYDEPILNPEIYDPQRNRWQLLPPQTYGRMYHATAVLLRDARVLSAGQERGPYEPNPFTGDLVREPGDQFAEIYEPAYLFRGPRPKIKRVQRGVKYGKTFTVTTRNAAEIESVALIRPSSVTHSVNTSQRYVALEFEQVSSKQIRVTAPEHGNLAPPGYYMLFILNADGVPSVAKMIRLKSRRRRQSGV